MMASVNNKNPATPKQAARRRGEIDRLMDAGLFKALGEPTRAKLLACLVKCSRPCSVTEVAECCTIDFSVVARHLGVLARVGLLDSKKTGRTVYYRASSDLAARFRAIADAIESWNAECCSDAGDCGCKK